MDTKKCTYCDSPLKVITGTVLYPNRPELTNTWYWRCDKCDAHVEVGSRNTLANRTLRQLRVTAHDLFDRLWSNYDMSRKDAYIWLASALNLPLDKAHIGMFNEEQCWLTIISTSEELNVLNNIAETSRS